MTIDFIYDKAKDKKCHDRFARFIKKNKTVWGLEKKFNPIIKIHSARLSMRVDNIIKPYEKIFNLKLEKIRGYIVTTPFSMINDSGPFKKEAVIYYSIYTANPSVVLGHELFHIYMEKYTRRKIPNYQEAKEYFTVIMNDVFKTDISRGYPNHQRIRKIIWDKWLETRSIDECLRAISK